ncbi:DUF3616 domain-containing protein [Variovorax sp. M-6]|uniref:DUF3616 domain-containing protein n=1 Tax=Variovorax sp. M-6 TaxID=3233041 RepID=UPI003F9CC600
MALRTPPSFQALTGIYEPSAIQQLPDGRFLVVEDEKSHPFSSITIGADGTVESTELKLGLLLQIFSDFGKLDDLEGLAMDQAGFVYAITSHSRDEGGHEKRSRERLVRFRVEGDRVVEPKVVDGLKRALTSQHPLLASAAEILDVKDAGGLNIEALEITPDQQRLLVGFRSPLHDGRAIIASVDNPAGIFEASEAPRVSAELSELDLGGHGIRGMSFLPSIGEYLVISGPVSREACEFALWLWNGQQQSLVRSVTVPGLESLARAEGVSPADIEGRAGIIIVSDDGNRKAKRSSSYLLLDLDQLQIAR